MQTALHIPSRQVADIIGYHHGQKAYHVQLPTGQKQIWTKSSTVTGNDNTMEQQVLMTIRGGKGKVWNVIDRIFKTQDDAYEYLSELTRLEPIKESCKNGQEVTLMNGWTLSCNHDMRAILKKKPTEHKVHDWYPFDPKKKAPPKILSNNYKAPTLTDPTAPKSKPTGKMVKLQDITADPRKARSILRSLVRTKKIQKPGRWEWEANSPDLEIVKKAISK